MMTSRPQRTHDGFTLIELLIVIAIIALLAAILFPVLARARENARRATCMSNQKQIGLAIMQYTQDNDETMPIWDNVTLGSPTFSQVTWGAAVSPYLGFKVINVANFNFNPVILLCPDDTLQLTVGAQASGQYRKSYDPPDPAGDTGVVGALITNAGVEKYWPGRPLSQIILPSTTLELVEWPNLNNEVGRCSPISSPNTQATSLAPYHSDGWNYLFCDGHVKWYRPEQTIGTGTMAAPKGYWTLTNN